MNPQNWERDGEDRRAEQGRAHPLSTKPLGRKLTKALLPASFVLTLLLIPRMAHAQTIVAAECFYPYDIQNHGYAYINPAYTCAYPMPEISFGVSGYPNCDSFHWQISVEYTDPAGYETYYADSYEGNDGTWDLYSWGGDYSGGSANVTLEIYNASGGFVGSADFYFTIQGYNQSKAQADANEGSLPWFGSRIIRVESSGQQFSPNPGNPVWGSPDGIGLMQPDREENPGVFSNCTYWNFVCNISSGEQVLSSIKSGAYSYWSTQTINMVNQEGKVVSAFPTPCAGNEFSYPQTGAYNYEDAEWLQRYNGGYYIEWSTSQRKWVLYSTTNNYLSKVCSATPY